MAVSILGHRYCTGLTCSDLDSLRYGGGSLQFHTVYSFKWKPPKVIKIGEEEMVGIIISSSPK
jgi:hypothetical protein